MFTFDHQALKLARTEKGITQATAGTLAGFGSNCPGQTWAAYENGKVPHPRNETIIRMALAVGMDAGTLIGAPGTLPMPPKGSVAVVPPPRVVGNLQRPAYVQVPMEREYVPNYSPEPPTMGEMLEAWKAGHAAGFTAGVAAGLAQRLVT